MQKLLSPSVTLSFAFSLLLSLGHAGANTPLVTADGPAPLGFDTFQFENILTQNGSNFFLTSVNWGNFETSPGQYDLNGQINNWISQVLPQYPFQGAGLIVKMIDSTVLTEPAYLQNNSLSDPAVQQSFLAMLNAIAQEPGAKNINYIMLGNEVDEYLYLHPTEVNAFTTLMKEGVDLLHKELPGVQVGTIVTSGALTDPQLFKTITQYSDFIDYTYYPFDGTQMLPVSQVPAELKLLASAAGSKPFAFTEIGYSSSPIIGSSQQDQADFVQTVFDTLEQYRSQLAFLSWSSLADPTSSDCSGYTSQQNMTASTDFCAFLDNLGLLTDTGQPKEAWSAFAQGASLLTTSPTIGGLLPETSTIPEPSTWTLMVLGLAGLGVAGYRKAKRQAPHALTKDGGRRRIVVGCVG